MLIPIADVPRWFQRARLFVFPTRWDPWGVVANEACLVGVPVLVSPHAGVADELIVDGINGRVLPLDETAWVAAASAILGDARLHTRLSAAARSSALPYSFQNAASGIVDAARQAISRTAPPPPRLSTFVRRQRVVCVQRRLTHYRVELFEAMRRQLGERGVEFVLAHGQAAPSELPKKDGGTVPWAIDVPGRYFLRENLVWQDLSRTLAGADLVIVPQENRLLYNLLLMSSKRPARLAFWGHGRNFQSTEPHGLKERFKQWTVGRVDWWFAYTELSTRFVAEQGFAPDRITTLDNAIDSSRLQSECRSISVDEIGRFRNEWNLGGGPVGLFIGSLYAEKRVGILLEAGAELARRVPGFHLVVVGDGPERSMVHQAAARYPWLRMLGVRHGHDKAVCLRAAHLILNPGLVGLGILDAFAAGVPLVTTDSNLHSPEIAYLRQGENGVMTADTVAAFAEAGISLLNDPAALERMGAQAAVDAGRYTLENMTRNFCEGIQSALKTRPH